MCEDFVFVIEVACLTDAASSCGQKCVCRRRTDRWSSSLLSGGGSWATTATSTSALLLCGRRRRTPLSLSLSLSGTDSPTRWHHDDDAD